VEALFEQLLTAGVEPRPLASLEAWWEQHRERTDWLRLPIERAIAGGFVADRLGYAFASGYQAAAEAAFGADRPGAFAATESGGVHPRAIATELRDDGALRLDGEKAYVTLGAFAERLFVVARAGEEGGRPRLVVVRIDRRPGVTLLEGPATPFAPEIQHAQLRLEGVRVARDEVLPGDGYADYLKPFRTVEDIHVMAALGGWLIQVGRRSGWPAATLEELAAACTLLGALAAGDPKSEALHLTLAGALSLLRRLVEGIEPLWAAVDAPTRERWERDRPLLEVASRARALRAEAAWRRLNGT
jgi:hypothetical protein